MHLYKCEKVLVESLCIPPALKLNTIEPVVCCVSTTVLFRISAYYSKLNCLTHRTSLTPQQSISQCLIKEKRDLSKLHYKLEQQPMPHNYISKEVHIVVFSKT